MRASSSAFFLSLLHGHANAEEANIKTSAKTIRRIDCHVPSVLAMTNFTGFFATLRMTLCLSSLVCRATHVLSSKIISHLPPQTNLQANIETDSWDTLCNKYSRVGESWVNTGLINVLKKYFNKAAVPGGATSNTGSSSGSAAAATIGNGDYYFKVANSSSQEFVVCADNTGNDPLIANRASYGGDWEKITVVNNSDGTISLKSGANGKYVCAVIDENSQLLARSASIGTWEKFYPVQAGDGKFGLKAVANNKYVCADFNNGGTLRAISDSVAGSWEAFGIYQTSGTQVNSSSATSSGGNTASNGIAAGKYYLSVSDEVIIAELK